MHGNGPPTLEVLPTALIGTYYEALRNWGFPNCHTIRPHTATLSDHWGQASSREQSECGRHGLSNILKLQATFL